MHSRRTFLGLALLLAAPMAVRAQQAKSVRRIGVLAQDLQPGLLETFRDELRQLGYIEGRGITVELRNAAGHNERLRTLVEELLRLKVDVIVAINTPAAEAAKNATRTVPIVMMRVADPVKSGLVASLAHPGGNVTGLSFMPDALGPKGVELLRETLPKLSRMATTNPRPRCEALSARGIDLQGLRGVRRSHCLRAESGRRISARCGLRGHAPERRAGE